MNKRLLFIAGATTLLSAAVVVTSFFATNRNFASTNAAGPIYIDPNPDPIEVVTVTPITLTYTDFNDFVRDRWAESPNGNLIGIHIGGSFGINDGIVLDKEEGSYITTAEVSANPSAKKYAFSEIMTLRVHFSGSLNVTTPSGTEALSNGVEKNLNSASYFRIDPASGEWTVVTSIEVTYNSTASFCNQN